ncbi:MAG TPA: hypothetical protein V6C65_35140 [Allocoleopsis sp.]
MLDEQALDEQELDEQEDESLGLEQLPQTELDSIPGVGEQPDSEAEMNPASPAEQSPIPTNQPEAE